MAEIARSTRRIHLIDADETSADGRPLRVAVPDGISRLMVGPNGKGPRCESTVARRSSDPPACLLEPLALESGVCLLVLAPDHLPVRINGQRLAIIACLRERDQVQLHDGRAYHVAIHTHCVIGRAASEDRNKSCAVCHQPAGERHVYLCSSCGCAIHCDRRDSDDVLDCLSICGECPSCHGAILRDGYGWTPEV
ncbi:MAG: hypothetical protein ACYSU7_16320 [Planctomycetota bacterium]